MREGGGYGAIVVHYVTTQAAQPMHIDFTLKLLKSWHQNSDTTFFLAQENTCRTGLGPTFSGSSISVSRTQACITSLIARGAVQ